ncbi:uncharacterized protein LOC117108906 [Anneissia japonica]|uniref:uncharacterized protein LOC117108906 n=1 Tax=Anneissia japonica TaxID=1529436 RepID=UPI00142564B7|nr:uncharacterized protein LOC117108906 [Anneissia japonica]
MAAIRFFLQSTFLLYFCLVIQGNEVVYFCPLQPVVITCNVDLVGEHVVYWYYNNSTNAVAAYTFRYNTSWPNDKSSPYFPMNDQLHINAAEDKDLWICKNGRRQTKTFVLHQFRTPNVSSEILNCPKEAVDRGMLLRLTCIASQFYPEESVEVLWTSSGDRHMCLETNTTRRTTTSLLPSNSSSRFNLRSVVSFNVLDSRNVTCHIYGSAMCTKNVTTNCSVVITDTSEQTCFSKGLLVSIAALILFIIIVAFCLPVLYYNERWCFKNNRVKAIIEKYGGKFFYSDVKKNYKEGRPNVKGNEEGSSFIPTINPNTIDDLIVNV